MSGGLLPDNIQMTSVVPLPRKVRANIIARAKKLLDTNRRYFGTALLHLYVKNSNSRVGCTVNLFTDDGRYHTYVEDWDVRRAADSALDTIRMQIVKHFEKRADMAREMLQV